MGQGEAAQEANLLFCSARSMLIGVKRNRIAHQCAASHFTVQSQGGDLQVKVTYSIAISGPLYCQIHRFNFYGAASNTTTNDHSWETEQSERLGSIVKLLCVSQK